MLSFTNMKGWFDANFDTAHLTLVSSGSDVGWNAASPALCLITFMSLHLSHESLAKNSKRLKSIGGLSVMLRFAHTDTHLPSHQGLSTNDSHNHSIYRQWPLQAQRLEPLGSGCNVGALNSLVLVKNALPFLLQRPTGREEKEGKSTKGGDMMRWWRDQMGGNGEGRGANPWSIAFPTQPHNLCSERQREEERERGDPRIGKSGDQRTLHFFLSCWDAAKRSERPQCEPLKKRENLLLHPSIQTIKLRCFSSCEATGRKSDRNTEIQTNPRKRK